MDESGTQGTPRRRFSGSRVSTKSRAPSPPVSLKGLDGGVPSQRHSVAGYPLMAMDQKENLLEQDLTLVVVLPDGLEKTTTVHGSKPMMDLLVMLCAKYHLNPSGHTMELVTTNRNHVKFKPNTLIGALQVDRVLLKPKGMEEKNKKPGPQMPEATVRLVINYKKTQKTILRVNPQVPLKEFLPAICEKCEFNQESTVLLRDAQSEDALDLTCTLNDFAIREVYARDMNAMYSTPTSPTTPLGYSDTVPRSKDKLQKEKENKGLFSLFRRSTKKSEQGRTTSAPASPVFPNKPRPHSMSSFTAHSSTFNCSTMPSDMPKKRRAPLPPMLVSQSHPSNLSDRQRSISASEAETRTDGDQVVGLSRSTESSLKRTKRRAPPPPLSPGLLVQEEAMLDEVSGGQLSNTLEEIVEQEETTASVVLDSTSDVHEDDSSLNLSIADISVDSERADLVFLPLDAPDSKLETVSPGRVTAGEDPSCDLSSDGKLVKSTVNSVEYSNPMLRAEMDKSEPAGVGSPQSSSCQMVEMSCQTTVPSEDSITQPMIKVDRGTASSPNTSLPSAQYVSTGTQALDHLEPDLSCNDQPVATSTPCPPSEDAQIQTDLTECLVYPHLQQEVPPPAKIFPSGPVGQKRDMATSTEPNLAVSNKSAISPASADPQCQKFTQSAPAPPKPSNELTRDYIPKVGMTTYTVVPQKTLEKLRYFEVELTLESPTLAQGKEVDIGSLDLKDCPTQAEKLQPKAEAKPLQPSIPKEYLKSQQFNSTTSPTNTTTVNSKSTVNGSGIETIPSPSTPAFVLPARDVRIPASPSGEQAGFTPDVKAMRIPPATKPKPGSLRLPQHKRTPGYYVTSAAVKSLSTSPGAGQKETPGSLIAATGVNPALQPVEESSFPPPPPPVQWDREMPGGTVFESGPGEREDKSTSSPGRSPTWAPLSPGLSLEKLRSFAAPKPYSPFMPSRFAQAVSSAVRRSRSMSSGSTSPSPLSPAVNPITSRFLLTDTTRLHGSKDGEEDNDFNPNGEGMLFSPDRDNVTVKMADQSDSSGHRLSMCREELRSNGETDTEPEVLPLNMSKSEPSKVE